jgi:hypothetical protein
MTGYYCKTKVCRQNCATLLTDETSTPHERLFFANPVCSLVHFLRECNTPKVLRIKPTIVHTSNFGMKYICRYQSWLVQDCTLSSVPNCTYLLDKQKLSTQNEYLTVTNNTFIFCIIGRVYPVLNWCNDNTTVELLSNIWEHTMENCRSIKQA